MAAPREYLSGWSHPSRRSEPSDGWYRVRVRSPSPGWCAVPGHGRATGLGRPSRWARVVLGSATDGAGHGTWILYIFRKIFFLPHLPLFQICATNLIHPYLPSTLTKHPHALLLPLCAAAAAVATRGPRRRPGAACPTPRHRRRPCSRAPPPPARVLPALVRRRCRHPRAAAGGQALLAPPRAAATACAQTLRRHPRALLLSVPLPALPCCCAAAARRRRPAPEKTRRKC